MMILACFHRVCLISILLSCVGGAAQQTDVPKETVTWREFLPPHVQSAIDWDADHEEGNLHDWEFDGNRKNNGGGLFRTGSPAEARVVIGQFQPLSGKFCAQVTIENAWRAHEKPKAVRLMRWTDKPWNAGGKLLGTAYYGVWVRIDKNYSTVESQTGSRGWWNVFQFKSDDRHNVSQPVWVLNIGNQAETGLMEFYLHSKFNQPQSVGQSNRVSIPRQKWFHLEALYRLSSGNRPNGQIMVWQDGQLILRADNVVTKLDGKIVWGIGNYTNHISGDRNPGTATIFFDDATISAIATHPHAVQFLRNRQ